MSSAQWIDATAAHMLMKYAFDIHELYDKNDLQDFQRSFADPVEFVDWFARKHDLDTVQFELMPRQRRSTV